jgi:hypothetical protein
LFLSRSQALDLTGTDEQQGDGFRCAQPILRAAAIAALGLMVAMTADNDAGEAGRAMTSARVRRTIECKLLKRPDRDRVGERGATAPFSPHSGGRNCGYFVVAAGLARFGSGSLRHLRATFLGSVGARNGLA